jgi:hypothetical protein
MGRSSAGPPKIGFRHYWAAIFHDDGCKCRKCLEYLASPLTAFERALVEIVPEGAPVETAAAQVARSQAVQEQAAADLVLHHSRVGNQFPRSAFAGSPQEAAILNLHLREYFAAHKRSRDQTPYAVLPSQFALLDSVGMELPVEGAPTVPHGLHKNLEEFQLRLLRGVLVAGKYALISCKAAKQSLLPTPHSVQNPVMESRDVHRYPESALTESTFAVPDVSVFVLHDVSSVVAPHELVERLVVENPSAHLFVTGVNPPEALERVGSFHPNSHRIVYDEAVGSMRWHPHGSESEGYEQPIGVTESWLQTNAIRASNGTTYQVVLLDYRLGHCLWHVFPADITPEGERAFPTGSLMHIPARYTGTWQGEWLDRNFVSKMLSFGERTTVHLATNYLAKANGLRASGGFISARDCHIGAHLCRAFHPDRSWWDVGARALYLFGCFVSLRWSVLLRDTPDIFELINERATALKVIPSEGGGWSRNSLRPSFAAIRNYPTYLEQVSVATALVATFVLPKIAAGAFLTNVWHTDVYGAVRDVWRWLDVSPDRAALTVVVAAVFAALPNDATRFMSRVCGHFYRQIWLPGSCAYYFNRAIVELCGAPGHTILATVPGRGWLWQIGLWLTIVHEIFPVFMSSSLTLLGCHSAFIQSPAFLLAAHPIAAPFWWCAVASPLLLWLIARVRGRAADVPPRAAAWEPVPALARTAFESTFEHAEFPGPAALLRLVAQPGVAYCTWLVASCRVLGANSVASCGASLAAAFWALRRPELIRARLPVALAVASAVVPKLPPSARGPLVVSPRLPTGGPRGTGHVSPVGMEYANWLAACRTSYGLNNTQYPALTANAHCFFASVAQLTGHAAHGWYSWFQAGRGVLPGACTAPFGETTTADMLTFCAMSGYGCDITGAVKLAQHASPGWPTLHFTITRNRDTTLHCEPRVEEPLSPTVGALAVVLASMRRTCQDWADFEFGRSNAARDGPRIVSEFVQAIYPAQTMNSFSAADWDLAWHASFSTRPIIPGQAGVHWNFALHAPGTRPPGQPLIWPSTFYLADPLVTAPVRGMGDPFAGVLTPCYAGRPSAMPRRKRPVSKKEPTATASCAGGSVPPPPGDIAPAAAASEHATSVSPPTSPANRTFRDATGVKLPKRGVVDGATRVRGPQPSAPGYSRVHELIASMEADLTSVPDELPPIALEPEVIDSWLPDVDRAQMLADDLQEHPELMGPNGSLIIAKTLAVIADYTRKTQSAEPIKLTLLLGCAGSGKSTATRKIMETWDADERASARIVTHTAQLRGETKQSFTSVFDEMRGFNFPTLGNILAQPTGGTVVFDDAGKFWGGILDLVAIVNPGVRHIIVNGDPAQGREQLPIAGTLSERLPTMAEEVSKHATKYATISHRMFQLMADTLGLHTTSCVPGFIRHTTVPTGHFIVTSSPRYVRVLIGGGRRAVTFGDVQGEEHQEPVELDITGLETAITDAVSYVGLTRSRDGIYIRGEALEPSRRLAAPTGSHLLNAILYDMTLAQTSDYRPDDKLARRAFYSHLRRSMPKLDWFQPVGYLPHFLDFQLHVDSAHYDAVAEAHWEEPACHEPCAEATPPCETFDVELAPMDKESREREALGMMTNQFAETAAVNPSKHMRTDRATHELSVQKRLRAATEESNRARKAACTREDMCAMFDLLVPNCPQWDDYGDGHVDKAPFEYAEGRTREAVLDKLARHDPDRTGSDVVISLKAQTIKKVEKLGAAAMGGQLIHEYDIAQTLRDAPYFRFLNERLLPRMPPNVFFYNRESVPEHIARMRGKLATGRGYTGSDVTGWDTGCDAGMLNFDLHVMRRCGFPEEFTAAYDLRRLTTRSQYGLMATMQNSGDRGTWDMNSLRRAVVSCIVMRVEPIFHQFSQTSVGREYVRKHVPGYAPPAPGYVENLIINGDDALLDVAKTTSEFPDSNWVFKDLVGESMEFSGMDFRPDGRVTFSPFGLYYRCLIKVESNTSDPIQWDAYATLYSLVDSESPYALEIARLLARHLTKERVLECTHPSLEAAVARMLYSADLRSWLSFDNVRRPPPRVLTHR